MPLTVGLRAIRDRRLGDAIFQRCPLGSVTWALYPQNASRGGLEITPPACSRRTSTSSTSAACSTMYDSVKPRKPLLFDDIPASSASASHGQSSSVAAPAPSASDTQSPT